VAGYSGTPLVKKLGLRPGQRVAFLNAPPAFDAALGPLPDNLDLSRELAGGDPFDLIVLFTVKRSDLEKRVAPLKAMMRPAAALWVAWPKRASRLPTDVTEDVVREVGLAAGLVDNKVCAVDEVWSGLRLVIRLKDRERTTNRV
jgi:hypothetical protein